MREKRTPLTGDAAQRQRARDVARVAKRRGYLIPQPCADCGAPHTEMHHPDYDKPLEVIWLCRPHHLARHRAP